jgi:hypothetical protein
VPNTQTRRLAMTDGRVPVPAVLADDGDGGAVVPVDPYAAYTGQVDGYAYDTPDLVEVLPPFVAGLLAVAGRLLAVLAYRDAFVLGDKMLNRRSVKAKATVFAHLPAECDRQDRAWRLAWARCLDDLAGDLEAGRAPLPRCTGERWALQIMADRAPFLLACSDARLAELGIPAPADEDEDWRPPYWDGVVEEFVVDDAAYSIPEAHAGDGSERGDDEQVEEPDDGWEAPRFWLSPYGITAARSADRGHPSWVQARLAGTHAEPAGGFDRAAELLGYATRADPWAAYTDEYRGSVDYRLAEVLTPQAAALLTVAAERLAEVGYQEVLAYGDEPLVREPDDGGGWYTSGVFLANLPPVCDGCNQAWRLGMVRAVDDLAGDLRAGQAPLPRCFPGKLACCPAWCCRLDLRSGSSGRSVAVGERAHRGRSGRPWRPGGTRRGTSRWNSTGGAPGWEITTEGPRPRHRRGLPPPVGASDQVVGVDVPPWNDGQDDGAREDFVGCLAGVRVHLVVEPQR